MYERVSDVLGVPGEVILIENRPRADIIEEVKEIMSNYPDGMCLKDMPEGNEKTRFRDLLKALGFEIQF